MEDLTNTKIAGAILATALGFMLIRELAHSAMHVEAPEKPVYALAIPDSESEAKVEVELPFPQPEWVAAMDYARGETVFKKCTSCHNAEKGGANGTGPNLWDIVGKGAAHHADFTYSNAMTTSGLTWDYETLNDYLTKPTAYVTGTNMNFVGLKKDSDRAAVIEYLRQHSDAPLPKPEPAASEVETLEVSGEGVEAPLGTDEAAGVQEAQDGMTIDENPTNPDMPETTDGDVMQEPETVDGNH